MVDMGYPEHPDTDKQYGVRYQDPCFPFDDGRIILQNVVPVKEMNVVCRV